MSVDPGIEAQYRFSGRYPERQDVYDTIARLSEAARAASPCMPDLPYGDHALARLDLFAGEAGRPLVVFVHGGFWRSMDKRSFSYIAPPLRELGYSVAILNYPLAPKVPLPGIVASVDRALDWLATTGRRYLPRVPATVLAGHSAGGHLAALAAGRRSAAAGVAGCVCVSGIFDLEPLMQTSLAAQVRLSAADVQAFSPLVQRQHDGWTVLAVGDQETDGFVHAQTGRFAAQRCALGLDTTLVPLGGANHYTVLLDLARADGRVWQAMHARLQD